MEYATTTGVAFLLGALMYWCGRVFLPVKPGTFLSPDLFGQVRETFTAWIWIYRVHMFGHLIIIMALVALAALLSHTPERAIIWPGVVVASAGLLVGALAQAFYYHFGAWGARETEGYSEEQLRGYVDSLKEITEYITCWVRFGRVFFGLGLTVLAAGLMLTSEFSFWITATLLLLGLTPMVITMACPDNLEYHRPVFHLQSAWLGAMGCALFAL